MQHRTLRIAALLLAVMAVPALADLQVTSNLGNIANGTHAITGTSIGMPNNAFIYTAYSNTGTTVLGHGENVYQFTLTKPAYLSINNIKEPDADGTFPDPNHDYLLMDSLVTFNSNNTATNANPNFPNFNGRPEGTTIAAVLDGFQSGTPGSTGNIGMFRTTANPKALYQPGTYYLTVDARTGTLASYGQSNQLPAGNYSATFNVNYLDEAVAPNSRPTRPNSTGSITGTYTEATPRWFEFQYTGQEITVDTENSLLGTSNDTGIALYDSTGGVVAFNDDVGQTGHPDDAILPFAWSRLRIAAGSLPNGTYYLGFSEYKAEINPGFNFRTYPQSFPNDSSGSYVINGLGGYLPGDHDLDDDVDFDDLVILAQNYDETSGHTFRTGDYDTDGAVGFQDLVLLAQNYGAVLPSAGSIGNTSANFQADWLLAQSLVPEPTCLITVIAVSGFFGGRRRR
jgi:hypothetical protein